MLGRQPLKFLLADDPGGGKSIMSGLYIRELLVRADLRRSLVISPGRLFEQWQSELDPGDPSLDDSSTWDFRAPCTAWWSSRRPSWHGASVA